jgi:hypothetical protein
MHSLNHHERPLVSDYGNRFEMCVSCESVQCVALGCSISWSALVRSGTVGSQMVRYFYTSDRLYIRVLSQTHMNVSHQLIWWQFKYFVCCAKHAISCDGYVFYYLTSAEVIMKRRPSPPPPLWILFSTRWGNISHYCETLPFCVCFLGIGGALFSEACHIRFLYISLFTSMSVCVCVCMFVCMYLCTCMYVCMYFLYMYVCNVCMCMNVK